LDKICVLGLGYIGLPTSAMFATHGVNVIGVDINEEIVEILNNGDIHIEEPGLKTVVQAAIRSGNLRVACEPEPADAFIIAVPTPINGDKTALDPTPLIRTAREVNDAQPAYVVALVKRAVGGDLTGKRIAALGLAYKPNVDDLRERPAPRCGPLSPLSRRLRCPA